MGEQLVETSELMVFTLLQRRRSRLFRYWPRLARFLYSSPQEYRVIKFFLGFPVGCLLALGLHFTIRKRLDVPESMVYIISGLLFLGLGVGYAISGPVRCISLLMLPTLTGKNGRSYIMAFAVAYLVAGPIQNIITNGKEVTRSLSCNTDLMSNMSAGKAQFTLKPFRDIMSDLQKRVAVMSNTTRAIVEQFLPMQKEVRDKSETEYMEKNAEFSDGKDLADKIDARYEPSSRDKDKDKFVKDYGKKMDFRCTDIFLSTIRSCKLVFWRAYANCRKQLGVVKGLCDIVTVVMKICNLVSLVPKIMRMNCDAMAEMGEFGSEYAAADQANLEFRDGFKANIQYKVVEGHEAVDQVTPEEVSKVIEHEFDVRKAWIQAVAVLIKSVIAFYFVLIIVAAYNYHNKYATDFKFDNFVISPYFYHIESRRRMQNKMTLLPLKSMEAKQFVTANQLALTEDERGKFVKGTALLVAKVAAFSVILLLDALLYEVLALVNKHCRVTLTQEGDHTVILKVHGTSVMSDLIRSIIGSINKKQALHQIASNLGCLPKPSKLDPSYLWAIYGSFFLLWIFLGLEAYTLRVRRHICAFFYPKREKKRIIFLYNDMLKKRRGFQKHARRQCRRKALQDKLSPRVGVLRGVINRFPRMFGWLRFLPFAKMHCLMCEEKESKGFVRCPNRRCLAGYCRLCWVDIHGVCYACQDEAYWSTDSEEDVGLND